ncbi:class I SAM-dependent methyltransferase [Tellurirhabdus rosea]|uniref:thiopurine S-methyltransferase n=1 Tax=Tellurirhabdus rosea TaxID=2674997 RepID=UPI0022593831|nr:thiopurine S-methyltransferase [Tellurirhabdus rosea]
MEKQFWIKSWDLGGVYTSFHRKDVHPYVLKHLTPDVLAGKTVFVPLCGKTIDMLYFSRYADRVVGVELAEKAVVQFFEENGISYRRHGKRYEAGNLVLFCQDLFELTTKDLGPLDIVYDRASLVALPLDMRMRYLAKMEELTEPGALYFLNTLEYAPIMATPPFSIGPDEVQSYFPNYSMMHAESPNLPEHRMVQKFNLDFLIEHGFWLKKLYNISQRSESLAGLTSRYAFS